MNQLVKNRIPAIFAALAVAGFVVLSGGQAAHAQDIGDQPTEESEPGMAPDDEQSLDDFRPQPQPQPQPQPVQRSDEPDDAEQDVGEPDPEPAHEPAVSDHASMVGHAGIGFFGVVSLPMPLYVCSPDPADPATEICGVSFSEKMDAPTIGIRYWASELVGLEFALGVGISTGMKEAERLGSTTVDDPPAYGGGVFHAGLPLAVGHAGHFVFEIIPEVNIGYGAGTVFGDNASADVDLQGFLIQVGARAGGEIHFGFIGVPQLALLGTIGFHLRSEHRFTDGPRQGPYNDSATTSQLTAGTSVDQNPWDFFITNVNAIYYFP